MASIRLFGRGRNTAAASGPAVDAALIADALEGLTAASMSTTWRCRHGAGVSIGEGAVDFAAHRSRATVIRGKYAFEYVRSGSSVYRAAVTDTDSSAGAAPPIAEQADSEPDADDTAQPEPEEELDPDAEDGDVGEDEDADAVDGDGDVDAALAVSDPDEADGLDEPGGAAGDAAVTAWEAFSDHDACGVHAYAEPAVLAAGVRAAGAVQPRGTQEVDGVALAAYAVTLKPKPGDPNRLLARLARQLRDHGANVVVVTAFTHDAPPAPAHAADDGDQDGDGESPGPRIVRLRVELPHWTPADDPTADHTVSVDLFEFDEPVSIQTPAAQGAKRRAQRSCADLALF